MKRIVQTILFLLLMFGICGFFGHGKIDGKWAYIHETEKVILELNDDGSARYKGLSYQYDTDKEFIRLWDESGEWINLRYRKDGNKLFLYEPALYEYQGDGSAKGLVGKWLSADKLSFEFSELGEFREDGVFTGIYRRNAEGTQFTLDYTDDFADTTCYYTIENNILRVEYPWTLVKVK